MDRRKFLNYLAAGGLVWAAGLGSSGIARAAGNGRILVVVFLRGGWDGLNVVVPHGEDRYYSLRPNIAIAPPATGDADSALDLDGFFGLHPSLAAIHNLYQEGLVAVMPAVHYPQASRSHFQGQDIIEDAVISPAAEGWLARYLQVSGGDPTQLALSLTQDLPRSLRGPLHVSTYPDLGNLVLATRQHDREVLGGVIVGEYSRLPLANNPSASLLHDSGLQLLVRMDELHALNDLPVEGGAIYPSTTFGKQMRQAAALVKGQPGLELVTLDLGGWDTHRNQGGGQADGQMSKLLGQFGDGVGAFFQDLGAAGGNVTLLAVSEFGRTVAENGSLGTDHGNATTWIAVGGGVRGGVYTGTGWPGLASGQLYEGRYLAHTVDFRAVYAECLNRVLGVVDPGLVIPGYGSARVGFLA